MRPTRKLREMLTAKRAKSNRLVHSETGDWIAVQNPFSGRPVILDIRQFDPHHPKDHIKAMVAYGYLTLTDHTHGGLPLFELNPRGCRS